MGSMVIGLCDNEPHVHGEVKQLVEKYSKKTGVDCVLIPFYAAKELLETSEHFDVLLLDIDMPEMDGIEAAYYLQDRGINYKIVMLTAMTDRYKDAFKVNAFRFVTKPIQEEELFETIDAVRRRMLGIAKERVYLGGIPHEIMQKDMWYISSDRDVSLIFTRCAEYQSEYSLKKWMERLDDRLFFQCHRSYIVNLGAIASVQKNMIKMRNGEKVPVSRRKRVELENLFMEYDTRRR